MSGINGFNFKNLEILKKMNETIRYRGPDDQGFYYDDNISLSQNILSTIELVIPGMYPLAYNKDENEIYIISNGEIYNYLDIKKDLVDKGYHFNTDGDIEVICASYLEYGQDCVKKFNGIWSFCIYDKKKKQLFCSRDRFGAKPFYYYYKNGQFIFSSEIKALLENHPIERKLNKRVAFDFLKDFLVDHTEETMFTEIFRLPPGSNLSFDLTSKTMKIEKYYDLKTEYPNSKWKSANLKDLFYDSIRLTMNSKVPIGASLSGGIDSSSIVCCIRDQYPNIDIKTFSLHFPGEKINEETYQKEVITSAKTTAHFVTFGADEIIKRIEELIYAQDEPFQSFSMFGWFIVFEHAHNNGIKVLLGGQGPDEILMGYTPDIKNYLLSLLRQKKIGLFLERIVYFLPQFFSLAIKYVQGKGKITFDWLNLTFPSRNYSTTNYTEEAIKLETFSSVPSILRYEDRISMHFGLQTRIPFIDYRFVEAAINIPPEEKFKKGYTKYAFRMAMKDILPKKILIRKDKIGFKTPDKELFLNSEFVQYIENIFDSKEFLTRKIWNGEILKNMLALTINQKKDYSFILIRILIFEVWMRVFHVVE